MGANTETPAGGRAATEMTHPARLVTRYLKTNESCRLAGAFWSPGSDGTAWARATIIHWDLNPLSRAAKKGQSVTFQVALNMIECPKEHTEVP